MKIQKFSFSHHRENWHIDEVSFDDFNLLVGPSGVGKTRILKALELIFDVALGREKLDDFEWTIHFSHLNKSYTWFLKSAIPENEDIFEIESKQFEVIEERLIQVENKTEIFHITSSFSKLNNVKLPKIKKTESAISLFPEEDLIFPLIEAFERIISSKSLNQLNKVKSTKLIPSIHSFNKQLVTNIKNTLFKNINRIQDLQDFFKQTTVNLEPLEKLLSLFMFQKRYADYEENDFDFFKNGFEWIKKHYLDIFTNVINIRIGMEENSDNTVSIFLEIQDTDSEEWIPQERMSSGMFRTLIYIIEVITAPEGSVILIDEFENILQTFIIWDLSKR
jgi:energy-coupling factor transporter ATP-binding protein EcfA2